MCCWRWSAFYARVAAVADPRGAGQDRDGFPTGAERVNILVTLPFPPERFHVQLFQTFGRVSGTQEQCHRSSGSETSGPRSRRPALLGEARRAAANRRMKPMRRLLMLLCALLLLPAVVGSAGPAREAEGRHGHRHRPGRPADRAGARLLREAGPRRHHRAALRDRRRRAERAAGRRERDRAGRRADDRRGAARHGPGRARQLQRQRHQARLRRHDGDHRRQGLRHRQGRPEEPEGQEDRRLVRHHQSSLHAGPAGEGRAHARPT